jgi:hypothetical protein
VPLNPVREEAMSDETERNDPKIEEKPQEVSDAALDQAAGGTLKGEILSNVSKTRSEISMTFARNARA